MQHTENYQLNLIQRDDAFSPDPLNENAQALDAALAAETETRALADSDEAAARQSADAALDARLAVLENHRIVWGYSTGRDVNVGFAPKGAFICISSGGGAVLTLRGYPSSVLHLTNTGFTQTNYNTSYTYCAWD